MPDRSHKLLLLASDVRSGSTILDRVLSTDPQIASVGELHNLRDFWNASGVGDTAAWRCSCGAPLNSCAFWTSINDEIQKTLGYDLGRLTFRHPDAPAQRRHFRWLGAFRSFRYHEVSACNCLTVVDTVARFTDARIVVDSSKRAMHFLNLHAARPNAVRVLYLVRDGRAVAYSKYRRGVRPLERAAISWAIANLHIIRSIKHLPDNDYAMVRYEDICHSPQSVITRALGDVDLPPWTPGNGPDVIHNIGGSLTRFESTPISLRVDTRWQTEMTASQRLRASVVCAPLNRWLGYNRVLARTPR